jgi:hypothetical protein
MRRFALMAGLALLSATSVLAQKVEGVHPDVNPLQIGVGYTFLSFNETPSTTLNSSGFNASAVYYKDWYGAEGDFTGVYGSQAGKTSQLYFGGGGIRVRLPNTFSFEPWAHGILGYTHLSPKTSLGQPSALGYKVGGGIDFNPHHSRLGYRVSADLFGNHFFRTYQLSPEVSVGVFITLGHE